MPKQIDAVCRIPNKKVGTTNYERRALEVFMDQPGIELSGKNNGDGENDDLFVLTATSIKTQASLNSIDEVG